MKNFDIFKDILHHEEDYYTEEGQKDYIEAFGTLQKLLVNLPDDRKSLINDLANNNYIELVSIIDYLTK